MCWDGIWIELNLFSFKEKMIKGVGLSSHRGSNINEKNYRTSNIL